MDDLETLDAYALVYDAVLRALRSDESTESIDDAINGAFDQHHEETRDYEN